MDLQSFLAELRLLPGDDAPSTSPEVVAVSAALAPQQVEEAQHLRLRVPSPKTEVRLGKTSDKSEKGMDGVMTSTAAHAWLVAGQNVVTVAGESSAKKAYEYAKAESNGQGIAQTAVSIALDLMKMVMAPTGPGMLLGASSIAGGVAKVALEKSSSGHLSVTAKESLSLVSTGTAQLSALIATTVWGGAVTKCGANLSVSIQGGAVASVSSAKTTCILSAFQTELVSGWETEVASRWGVTHVRGTEIAIGVETGTWTQRLQRRTREVLIDAADEVRLTTSGGHAAAHHDALVALDGHDVEVEGKDVSVSAHEKASFHVGSSTVTLEKTAIQLTVSATLEPSLKASSSATYAYMQAMQAIRQTRDTAMSAAASPMLSHAAAAAARASAEAAYEASKAAAEAARTAARKVAQESAPTLRLSPNMAALSTGATNGVKISRVHGIKITSGAGEISMSPAGIVLKFGPSKIILGPAGIVIDAGPGLITQKASLVNSP